MRKTLPLLLLTSAALAHEFWLAPASYRVAVGASVPLQLLVGENFQGAPWPRPTRRAARFVRLGAGLDSTDLRPALLADSAAPTVRCPAPGTHLVVLTSRPAFTELPAAEFTAYLRAEGLESALAQRRARGETDTKPGREAYQRCAKTLLLAGTTSAADTTYRRVVGLPLELVPEQNPYLLPPGAALTVRLLRAGRPVAGALVQLWQAGTATPRSARTNRQGRALLRLPSAAAGPYLLAAVQLEAAPAGGPTPGADWLSSWASLTFGGPAARVLQTK